MRSCYAVDLQAETRKRNTEEKKTYTMCRRLVDHTFIHIPFHSHTLLVLCGKKANKKSKRKANSESTFQENNANAPRITSNVKQNLHVLKQQKVLDWPNSQTPKPSTRFRRNKEKQKGLSSEEVVHEDSPKLDNKKEKFKGKRVLLVDGYNVCGHWPKLKQHFIEGRLEQARQGLLDELAFISAMRDVKVVVVYDAMKSGRRNHKKKYGNVDIVYSAKSNADNWIKREVEALVADGCHRVCVVTSDNYEKRRTLHLGAKVWSCDYLIEKIKDLRFECIEEFLSEEQLLELRL